MLPENLVVPLAACLGLVCGSFANVLIARMPTKMSVVKPRSRCPSCRRSLSWYENIPVLSYVALRGRCRSCRKPISLRYPVVELLVALLFVASVRQYGLDWTMIFRDWPVLTALVAVVFIDLDHRIIPDRISLPGLAWSLAWSMALPGLGTFHALCGAAVGFLFFYGVAWLYERRTGRSGLGGGDIKLLAWLGAFLGPQGVFTTVLVSSVTGSVIGLAWAALENRGSSGKRGLLKASLPYGPFLVLGALVHYFFGEVLWLRFSIPT